MGEQYREISVDAEFGSAFGYEVDSTKDNLQLWLYSYIEDKALLDVLRSSYKNVAILKNINVEVECQGEGYGSELLNKWLDEVIAPVVLLISDSAESQKEGFVLDKFYEDFGFEVLRDTPYGSLMILKR